MKYIFVDFGENKFLEIFGECIENFQEFFECSNEIFRVVQYWIISTIDNFSVGNHRNDIVQNWSCSFLFRNFYFM